MGAWVSEKIDTDFEGVGFEWLGLLHCSFFILRAVFLFWADMMASVLA
jgi:hypothetical protein